MNIQLNQKIIKEMCGNVSFKRGDSFYRNNKVIFEQYSSHYSKAIVQGAEDFDVTIQVNESGEITANCSCPKLASFQKDCQHTAAVLLQLYHHQKDGTVPFIKTQEQDILTNNLMTIFDDKPIRSSRTQRHFEQREPLDLVFTLKLVQVANEENLFGIEVKIKDLEVNNIRLFLDDIKEGKLHSLSSSFIYDPKVYCFSKEADDVIQELIKVVGDEKSYLNVKEGKEDQLLLIPPSSWVSLRSVLTKTPFFILQYHKERYEGLQLSTQLLPIQFLFEQSPEGNYTLNISGIDNIILLHAYHSVLLNGKLTALDSQDFNRLFELKGMLEQSGTHSVPIQSNQVSFFLEKVVPGLKKLGTVHISRGLSQKYSQTPLLAKLFLDRVNNRLLAGLEFHYDHIMLNPVEKRDVPAGTVFIRDVEKEEEILNLMDDSSFAKTDSGYILYNEELEYEFLFHTLPKLQKLVRVYATTAIRNRFFTEKSKPIIRIRAKKERINWLEYKFEMDGIPEREIKDLLTSLEEKRKYYRLKNGTLLSLETKEMEEIQRFLLSPSIPNEGSTDVFDLPITESIALLEEGKNIFLFDDSFQKIIEGINNPSRMPIEVPDIMKVVLKDYQIVGFKWMKTLAKYGFGGVLADDMGLGKTVQSIAFMQSEIERIRQSKEPVLVVCPSSLTYNWQNECMKFSPEMQTIVIDGKAEDRMNLLKDLTDIDIIITSYPLLRKDIKWYEKRKFHSIFFDEAQAFKNPITQTAKIVKKLQANHRFALTGTPIENSLEELWSIFNVVFPSLFRGIKEYSNLTRKQISRKMKPFLLRRLKEDVLSELPRKKVWRESVDLLPEQKKLYGAYLAKLRHDTLKHLNKDTIRKNRIRILAGLTRLRQICCHPSLFVDGYVGGSAKLEQLMEIIEESKQSGRRVLIFSQFTKMLELIGSELAIKGMPFFYLDGNTPSEERMELCHRYNAGERDYFLISLKAGGTGLNLMTADTVILYDTWWNPAVEEQAADRAHRIGQRNVVEVIRMIAKGTIEEKIDELQAKKKFLVDEILDSEEKLASVLSEENIRELLTL